MGGLGDDVDANGQNRATQSTRQPGSAIKPLAAIAPALESGIIQQLLYMMNQELLFLVDILQTHIGDIV